MRILQINSVCGFGSTGRITTDLYDALEANGHECCIAYGRGVAPNKYRTIKIGNKYDFYLHVLQTRLMGLHGYGSKRATIKLISEIEEYDPDLIQLHNLHGYYINIEILFNYLSEKEVPTCWLLHDQWSFSPHAAYFDIDRNDSLPKRNQYKRQKYEYPKSYIDRSEKNYSHKKKKINSLNNLTIITPSKWLADMAKKSFLTEYPIKVIHNGIDLEKFKPTYGEFRQKYSIENKKLILGVASVWDDRKGLNIFNSLADKLNGDYQIVLVGIKDKDKRKVNKKIITIGRTNNIEELAEIYTTADIFLNPTFQDNFPTTNLEALACGTPVITFDTGGSSESLNEDVGIVVKQNDRAELFSIVQKFDYEIDYTTSCVQRAADFDKNIIFEKYIELYEVATHQPF